MKKNIPQLLDLIEKRICDFGDQAALDTLSDKQKETIMSEMDIFCVFILSKARLSLERAYHLQKMKKESGHKGCGMHEELFEQMEQYLEEVEDLYQEQNDEN